MTLRSVSVQEAAELLDEGGAILLDVREPEELELAAVPHALHVPLRELPQRIGDLPRDKLILTFCHHGIRSAHAAAFLRRQGFDDVLNVQGGIAAWARDVDEGVGRY